jgi:hypothetical protein
MGWATFWATFLQTYLVTLDSTSGVTNRSRKYFSPLISWKFPECTEHFFGHFCLFSLLLCAHSQRIATPTHPPFQTQIRVELLPTSFKNAFFQFMLSFQMSAHFFQFF